MSQSPQLQHNNETFPQSVIYAYPPAAGVNDEINLGEVLAKLMGQWKIMAAIVLVGALLSIVVALLLPKIYKVDSVLALPTEADISIFTTNGLSSRSSKEVFKRYYNKIRSDKLFSSYIIENDYLPRLFPSSTASQDQMASAIAGSFVVTINEPLPATKGALVESPERITIEITHQDEPLVAELLAAYTEHIGTSLINSMEKEQRIVIAGKIKQLETKVEILRIREKKKRIAEIARLQAKNNEKINRLNQQIDASIAKATASTLDRLVQINESRSVAESLGIVYPTELKEIKGSDTQGDRLQTLIQVNDNDSLPLFLMGTRYLDSLIASIKDRKNEAAFVGDINEMRKDIALLKNDAALAALVARESDDPYIPEVPDIQANIAELKTLSLDFGAAKAYSLEKEGLVTGLAIKPNRVLIVVLGVVLSGMLALLVGVIIVSMNKRELSDNP
jgi:LPS O-antigen subunit length determinant protein (WzzB/FepE family)